jgi:LmbE family N-acetylglucosaminyl deacetylase
MPVTLVISPHYDDAVMSCGHWLHMNPGAIVATVCSGLAGPGISAGAWDKGSGFTTADQATAARQAEDLAALRVLDAKQCPPLGFLDREYQYPARTLAGLEVSIGAFLDVLKPDRCLVPLGVKHPDHIQTARPAVALWLPAKALRQSSMRTCLTGSCMKRITTPCETTRSQQKASG